MADYDPRPGINAFVERLQAENGQLRAALETLLLNYCAALPEGQKDQRSIRKANEALYPHWVGEYAADYTKPAREEIQALAPGVDELLANSKPKS